jgi:hypothetical protein
MHRPIRLLLVACLGAFAGCDRSVQEGDLKFIGFRYLPTGSAYVSSDGESRMGEGFVEYLNASPHLKIEGDICRLDWVENKPDGTKFAKNVSFPVSNIHSFKWKE